jgi:predicted O-methyltransferase YrrM
MGNRISNHRHLFTETKRRTADVRTLLRTIRRHFYGQAKIPAAILKKKANRCKSINDIVELSFDIFGNFPFNRFRWRIRPGQVKEEIIDLLKILAKRRPKVILEIGTAGGGTLFLFARVSNPDAVIISIDMPGGRFGQGYPEWRVPFYKSFGLPGQKIYLIRKDSHVLSTLDIVNRLLKNHSPDFLFIDGDHTYDGVKMDFEMYSKLVNKGGIIAFHDICPHPPETGCEVNKFWLELKERYAHREIIKNCNQGWAGIGVVYTEQEQ